MKLREFVKLGGTQKSKDVMTSRVMIKTGDTSITDFAGKLWELVANTNYLRPSVHAILFKGLTHKEASETFSVKESYLRNLIGREGKRLAKDLGTDPMPILEGKTVGDMSRGEIDALHEVVEGLIATSDPLEEGVLDKLTINIQNTRTERTNTISDSDFIKLVQSLDFLSKPKMESKLESTGQKTLGYLVYLLRTDDKYLSKNDKTRKEIIKEVWWL